MVIGAFTISNLDPISVFAMLVSLLAMVIQLTFGLLSRKQALKETARQVAETKKQEAFLVFHTEETYKNDVRAWGRQVVDAMARAQQLCTIEPKTLLTSDYIMERGATVACLRGLLNRAKWLFPNLATPSHDEGRFTASDARDLSALETVLYSYHTLDQLKGEDAESRQAGAVRIRRLRNEFVREMRRAVDPQVRGQDIETLVAETEQALAKAAEDAKSSKGDKDADAAAAAPIKESRLP